MKNSGVRVDHAVSNVEEALLLGALLTVLVVFLFLNSWRSTVITGVALPISVLASFIAVWALGFKLETMSLLGLSLAIGILIDDAIVVRENIVRHVEMGKDHFRAAHDGTDEIGLAVAATTFSILAVFVPIGFMPGIGGQWFKPFALTIACSVAVSLFVSFSLDPMLSAYWADPHKEPHERGWITRQLDKFNRWFNAQAENYKKVIAWALDHRAAMMTMAALTFFASFFLPIARTERAWPRRSSASRSSSSASRASGMHWSRARSSASSDSACSSMLPQKVTPVRTVGTGFFPEDDRAEFIMALETPPGSNLEYTRLKAEEAARIARAHSARCCTRTRRSATARRAAWTRGTSTFASCRRTSATISVEQFAEVLRHETKQMSGATISVFTSDFDGGFKQIQLQLRGQDVAALAQAADMVKAEVEKIPGAVDIGLSTKGQKPELEIELNRGVAGSLGLTVGQVAQSLRPAFAGIDAGDWIDPTGKSRKVTVRLTPESRQRASDLDASADGRDRVRTACRRRCRSVRSRRSSRASDRRSSTTSIASRS